MIRRQRFWTLGLLLFAVAVVSILFSQNFLSLPLAEGSHGGTHELSGYAWSSNIGWIRFKGVTRNNNEEYGVSSAFLPGSKFESDSYAWSSNIGWIRFDPSTSFASGDGWPSGAVNLHGVKLAADGSNQLIGWARACSVFENDIQQNRCQGELRLPEERGGWDGWVSLNCSNTSSCPSSDYKVTYDSTAGKLSSFAWGADVVGWIDFCPNVSDPTLGAEACVTVDTLNVQCQTTDTSGNPKSVFDLVAGTVDVVWTTVTPTDPSLTYQWSWDDGRPTVPNQRAVTQTYTTAANSIQGTVLVTPGGSDSCLITVRNPATPQLTVNVNSTNAAGKVTASPGGTNDVPPNWSSPAGTGCQVSLTQPDATCQTTYTPGTSVSLQAIPGPIPESSPPADYSYNWINCPGTRAGDTCTVMMNDAESASVTFWDPNNPMVILTPDCSSYTNGICTIWISFHSEGQTAESNEAGITANRDAELCVASFISRTGDSIDTITDNAPNTTPQDRVECILGSERGSCTDGRTCIDISHGAPVAFSVKVPTRLIQLVENNPYQIILWANGRPDSPISIRFEYRVRDIRP